MFNVYGMVMFTLYILADLIKLPFPHSIHKQPFVIYAVVTGRGTDHCFKSGSIPNSWRWPDSSKPILDPINTNNPILIMPTIQSY